MPTPKPKTGYKTKRKYSCPYCDEKMIRSDLIDHIEKEHEELIPEGYNGARVVYDHINGKNYGTCFICGDKVFEWDDKLWRYKNLCNKKSCRDAVHKKAMNNNLNDPEKQKLMLQNRKISGNYKFQDGEVRSYVGSYERKALEFIDKVMNISGNDIATPGPTFTYTFEGQAHSWITDIFYIPAMLVIDVKDGGDNPNNRPMESYREKQIEKEKAIIKDGRYNYLRLTNNNFAQFMSAVADIRYGEIVNDPNKGIYINEGAMPPAYHSQDYIIPCGMQGMNSEDTEDFVFGNTMMDKAFKFDKYGNLITGKVDSLLENIKDVSKPTTDKPDHTGRKRFDKIKYKRLNIDNTAKLTDKNIIDKGRKAVKDGKNQSIQEFLLETLLERPYTGIWDLYMSEMVEVDTGMIHKQDPELKLLKEITLTEEFVQSMGSHLSLMKDPEGYYLTTNDNKYLIVSDYYDAIDQVPPDVVELMDDLYEKNTNRGDN